ELHATGDGELTGVQASTQALRPTRGEDGPGLVDVERSTLAERIDPARVRGARGEHGPRDEVDVSCGVARELRRHDVRAQIGRLVREVPRDAELALLLGDGEPVAALDLNRGGALRAHLGQESACAGEEGL